MNQAQGMYVVTTKRLNTQEDADRMRTHVEEILNRGGDVRVAIKDPETKIEWVGPEPRAYAMAQYIRAALMCRFTMVGEGPSVVKILAQMADYLDGTSSGIGAPPILGSRFFVYANNKPETPP